MSRSLTICGAVPAVLRITMSPNCWASESRPRALIVNWKGCLPGTGGPAALAGAGLDVSAPRAAHRMGGGGPEGRGWLRIEPHPHAVRACPEDSHLADSREPGQRVLQVDERIVGE